MTKRSIVLGLLCALFISGFGYIHDCIINPAAYIRLVPHLMPHVVYGVLLLTVLLLNPLLRRVGRRPLAGGELAVVAGLSLISCSVPFYGLVHCWPSALMLPHHYQQITPGWQREHILDAVPRRMLVDVSTDEGSEALTGYVAGMGEGTRHVTLGDVPWGIWFGPLRFWLPLVLTVTIAMLALAMVVHQQWARHEQLPYPISKFASMLFPDSPDCVLGNRAFLVTMGGILCIHMINYLHAWWPEMVIPVQLRLNFSAFSSMLRPIVWGDGGSLFHPRIMFAVIGIAYFFASDVSFSLAITPYLMCYLMGILTGYGIQVTRGFSLFNNTKVFLYTGGYTGIALMALYTGRYYYLNLARQSVGLPCRDPAENYLVWAMRVFFIGLTAFWILLQIAGLDWLLALLYTSLTVVIFTAVSRAIAEAGAFYVGTWVMPGAIVWGCFGSQAIGPSALATMVLISVVVLVGPGWAPMPFAVQSLKLADLGGVKLGRMGTLCIVTLLLCIAVALPVTIYCQHDAGVMNASSGWARYTPKLPFDQALDMKQQLKAVDLLEKAEAVSGFGRVLSMKPDLTFFTAFAIGVSLAVAVSFMRLRFPWWPLHPVVFVFFGSHQAQRLAFSFLLGWIVKTAVCKYGGEPMYQKGKPIMAGLIAGEVLAGTIPIVVGAVYYVATGDRPVNCSLVL